MQTAILHWAANRRRKRKPKPKMKSKVHTFSMVLSNRKINLNNPKSTIGTNEVYVYSFKDKGHSLLPSQITSPSPSLDFLANQTELSRKETK